MSRSDYRCPDCGAWVAWRRDRAIRPGTETDVRLSPNRRGTVIRCPACGHEWTETDVVPVLMPVGKVLLQS